MKKSRVHFEKKQCYFCGHTKVVTKNKGTFCTRCKREAKGYEERKNKYGRIDIYPKV